MRSVIASVAVVLLAGSDIGRTADAGAPSTPATPARGGRGTPNTNDFFYRLGPDSKPMDGVPKGKFSEAKVIPSNVFPGTQHTYWVLSRPNTTRPGPLP